MAIPLPDESVKCHHTGFKDTCRKHAMSCPKFIQLSGKDPQSEQVFTQYGCLDSFMPKLILEATQQMRMAAAETGEVRNSIDQLRGDMGKAQAIGLMLSQTPDNMGKMLGIAVDGNKDGDV